MSKYIIFIGYSKKILVLKNKTVSMETNPSELKRWHCKGYIISIRPKQTVVSKLC